MSEEQHLVFTVKVFTKASQIVGEEEVTVNFSPGITTAHKPYVGALFQAIAKVLRQWSLAPKVEAVPDVPAEGGQK